MKSIILLFLLSFASSIHSKPLVYTYALFNESTYNNTINNFTDYVNTFKIHGLWVEAESDTGCSDCVLLNDNFNAYQCKLCFECIGRQYPEWCDNNIKFDIDVLKNNSTLWNQIELLYEPNPELLLKHEYLKHGTCTNYDVLTYFDIVIGLYYKIFELQSQNGKFCTECFCLNSQLDAIIF